MRFSFDLDGTLVDSLDDITTALNRAVEPAASGVVYSRGDVQQFIGRGAGHLVQKALDQRGLDLDANALLRVFLEHYERGLLDRTAVYPGIVALLEELAAAGHRLSVCTNKPGDKARRVVRALLPDVFDVVIGPDDAGAKKPDPAMLHQAAEHLGGPLHAHVGDSVFDLDAATAAGVHPVAVTWGYAAAEDLPGDVAQARDAAGLRALLLDAKTT